MAVSMTHPIPAELMISVLWRKWLSCKEDVDNSFDFCKVLTSFLQSLDIFLELTGLAEPHLSQEA